MDEVENQGVLHNESYAQEEIAAPQTESAQDQFSPQAERQAIPNHAWAAMRRKNEELEKKASVQDELLRQLLKSQITAQPAPKAVDIIEELKSHEYVPGDKVAYGFKQLQEEFDRKLQQVESKYASIQDKSTLAEMRSEHRDFDEIVNSESLALLKETDPRRATALEHTSDPYVRWATTYDIIKARGLSDKASSSNRAKEVDKRLEQNKKVIQSPQAYEKRPMAKAFDYSRLDDQTKEELRREMYGNAARVGGVPYIE